jgi:hypothetical protein
MECDLRRLEGLCYGAPAPLKYSFSAAWGEVEPIF